ncbi:uncharacterized protein SCHCODRAFT_02306153 [Schizophyllum commune H4-8]|uniref:uncharacterized protein n=1 Tax=Schizophyllum commune (strain H4-8 / FGSC 9210) TaxID=578458 RepID=UPI002160BD49|nr:uncharacterized protein SCHCODRAFT_02306153 [Schizophyllum commune H4-8]KAI5890929.1 hypothetical protein SCHCODRAFT_02306153 [Schizophyllum commune H4-8]
MTTLSRCPPPQVEYQSLLWNIFCLTLLYSNCARLSQVQAAWRTSMTFSLIPTSQQRVGRTAAVLNLSSSPMQYLSNDLAMSAGYILLSSLPLAATELRALLALYQFGVAVRVSPSNTRATTTTRTPTQQKAVMQNSRSKSSFRISFSNHARVCGRGSSSPPSSFINTVHPSHPRSADISPV